VVEVEAGASAVGGLDVPPQLAAVSVRVTSAIPRRWCEGFV
jgi:hypothetical protein